MCEYGRFGGGFAAASTESIVNKPRFLFFNYNDWDDDAPRGWHALTHKSTAATLEEVREEVRLLALETKVRWGRSCRKLYIGADYHIVDVDTLEIAEEGKCATEWNEDGNTYKSVKICKSSP